MIDATDGSVHLIDTSIAPVNFGTVTKEFLNRVDAEILQVEGMLRVKAGTGHP